MSTDRWLVGQFVTHHTNEKAARCFHVGMEKSRGRACINGPLVNGDSDPYWLVSYVSQIFDNVKTAKMAFDFLDHPSWSFWGPFQIVGEPTAAPILKTPEMPGPDAGKGTGSRDEPVFLVGVLRLYVCGHTLAKAHLETAREVDNSYGLLGPYEDPANKANQMWAVARNTRPFKDRETATLFHTKATRMEGTYTMHGPFNSWMFPGTVPASTPTIQHPRINQPSHIPPWMTLYVRDSGVLASGEYVTVMHGNRDAAVRSATQDAATHQVMVSVCRVVAVVDPPAEPKVTFIEDALGRIADQI